MELFGVRGCTEWLRSIICTAPSVPFEARLYTCIIAPRRIENQLHGFAAGVGGFKSETHRVDQESGSTLRQGSYRDFQSNCGVNLQMLG
jgi:hypothetical protein